MCESSINSTPDAFMLAGCRHGPEWVITLCGELDISCSGVLRDGFTDAAKEACDRVVVDARGVTFVDCGGLSALQEAASVCDAEVWLRSPSPPILGLAELAGEWRGTKSGDEIRIA
jgi:anti-anti-sigma factor